MILTLAVHLLLPGGCINCSSSFGAIHPILMGATIELIMVATSGVIAEVLVS